MYQYTEAERNAALRAADARKRHRAWMSKPFAGHDVRALREAAKGDADGVFAVPPSPIGEAELGAREALADLAAAWARRASREERVAVLRDVGALCHLEAPEGNLERARARAEADEALGRMLTAVLRERRAVRLREAPFPLTRVARLPSPSRPPSPAVPHRQTLFSWLRARLPRFGEQSAAQPFRDPRSARSR